MNVRRVSEICQNSLEMNRDMFAEGEYEIACQILLVALRCGRRPRDIQYLAEVERLAEKESRYIDDHHPESPYSNKSAAGRGDLGVFHITAQQAKAIIQEIQSGTLTEPAPEVRSLNGRGAQQTLSQKAKPPEAYGLAATEFPSRWTR